MSIQNKPDYKIFAGSAKSGEVVSFPDIARGWGVTIDKTGEIPPMEWFNAIGKRVDEWLMYLTQRGVSQWDISVEYPTMAMVQYGGNFYVSLKDNKGQDPTSSSATWENIKKWIGMDGKLNTSDVIQSTGSSTTKVMSQKAVTDALTLKVNYSTIVQETGQNSHSIMGQKAVTDALDLKVNYSAIVQTTGQNQYSLMSQKAVTDAINAKSVDVLQQAGTSIKAVMSQKAVTDALDLKVNYSAIVQETGQNSHSIMGQKAVTDALGLKVNYSAIVQTTGQNDYSIMSQKAVTDALASQAYPAGAPIPWPQAVAPAGFLVCNGQSFNKTTYPLLTRAYPSGVLPDLRGEFIRGLDAGRNIDKSRDVLTAQGDAIRNITGEFTNNGNAIDSAADSNPTGAFMITKRNLASNRDRNDDGVRYALDASLVVPTANENRPRNIAFLYIVRAA